VSAKDAANAHRPWTGSEKSLDEALARREKRTLSKALTFRCAGTMYCVKTDGPGTALRGAKVTLYHFADGTMDVHYKDRILLVTAVKTYSVPSPTEDEKTLDARVEACIARLQPPFVATAFLS